MVPALKKPLTYILGFIFTIIGVGTPFLVFAITKSVGASPFPYYYLHLILVCAFAFLAYLFGDLVVFKYRSKNKEANNELPDDVTLKVWTLRWPAIFAMIATLIVFIILYANYLATHTWPLF